MAKGYGGYFMGGLASGLQSGLQIGQQLKEMKWQKQQKEELKKKYDELQSASLSIQNKIKEYGLDGTYSDNEITDLSTMMWAGGTELQEIYKQTLEDIKKGNEQKVKQDFELIDAWRDEISGLSVDNISSSYEELSSFITTDAGKNYLNANASIKKKKAAQKQPEDVWGQAGTLPQDIRPDYLRSKGIDIPQPAEQPPTELDLIGETQQKLDAAYATGNANYFNQMAKSLNVPTTFETYKQKYEKPEAATGAKPKVQDPNDVLFGTNGIMKAYIGSGSQLGEEQKAEIRNNYNLIKPSLSADVRTQVEDYLKQIGIDVNAPVEAPIPEPTPEAAQPNILQKGVAAFKNWLGMKGTPQQQGQQDYTAMGDDELADLALTGDQAAIDELKRRGLL